MGKLRMANTEYNYMEINKQLKEQFIHGLNDSGMSIQIINECTKIEENDNVTNEQVLPWARSVEAQKAHSGILENLNETEDFDNIFARNGVYRQNKMQL